MNVDKDNIIDFLSNPSFKSIKMGDHLSNFKKLFEGNQFKQIKNKHFLLISINNVELTFINDVLHKLHFEQNKPNTINEFNIQIASFKEIREIIKMNFNDYTETENKFIGFDKVKIFFKNGTLSNIFFG